MLFALLIVKEPDLGTAIACMAISASILFVAGMNLSYFWYALAASPLPLYFLVVRVPWRWARVQAFFDPFKDPQGKGFHTIQSMIAVSTGGLTGLGLMEGKQKLFYLPEPHTDFIFAVTAEELGLWGSLLVVALFGIFLYRGIRVALRTDDMFAQVSRHRHNCDGGGAGAVQHQRRARDGSRQRHSAAVHLLRWFIFIHHSGLRRRPPQHHPANGLAMRVIVAGGGTGGHVIPALAIAQELRAHYGAEVVFVGTQRGIETRLVPAAGFELRLIKVGALKRVDFATRLRTLLALPRALAASASLVREFRPQVMIGVGGYASGPAMFVAAMMSIPTVAFEPNVLPGVANRLVAPMVSAAAVHFPSTCHYFRNCIVTGVPVRPEFFRVPPRSKDARPTLLVFGGSQGAHAINEAVLEALPKLMEAVPDIHIIHQTGEKDYAEAQAAYLRAMISAEVSPFIDDMPAAFARADLLLCRSGASTVAEITAAGKPAIFIPLPTAADDHQTRNAATLAEAGAARLLPQSELTSERLLNEITTMLRDRPLLAKMSEAARCFAHPDAAARIASLAARVAGVPGRHAVA